MRILIVMDPGIVIPVKGYGGIERIIEMLANEYLILGHEVDLLITRGSKVKGALVHGYGSANFPPSKSEAQFALFFAWKFIWNKRKRYDFIHNFGRLIYLLPVLNNSVKKIMSYQREITTKNISLIHKLKPKNLQFTGCSADLIKRANVIGKWSAIHNCCQFDSYSLNPDYQVDAPLIFLGRIERIKGCHTAISIAKASKQTLIIAGNVSPLEDEKLYFETEIKPQIDGIQIKYIGSVDDAQKNKYLGLSKALLMPIEWNEPFGIVMVEAMACGTPVIAFNRGSVNEVIIENITGFKVDNYDEMLNAVHNLSEINRTKCRETAELKFDSKMIARQYLNLVTNNAN